MSRGSENVDKFWYAELQPMIENKMSTPPTWCKLFNNFDARYGVSKLELICLNIMNNF